MPVNPNTFRIAVYSALLISVFGLILVCAVFVGFKDTISATILWTPQIIVGYVAMVTIIEAIGIPLRRQLIRYWAGALFGLSLFIAGVIAGSSTSMVVYNDYNPYSYIYKPFYWLVMYGFIPALAIGAIGSKILRVTCKKSGEQVAP